MTAERVCLTLVADWPIRQELFDFLAEQTDLISGFTASDAAGHGGTARLHSASEQVKGRAERVLVRMVLEDAAAAQLLERLHTAFGGAHITYWTTPISRFGLIE
jgi:hypothetical protein